MAATDPFARVRADFVETTERLLAELKASPDPEKQALVPRVERALAQLRDPSKVKRRVPASGEVMRHRLELLKREVRDLELALDETTDKEN